MEAFRVAGRAIVRSPSAGKSCGHKKLPENWTDTKETLLEGMSFHLKELGSTLVDAPKGEELTALAVKRIVAMAKASGRKLRKVTVTVSPKGLVLHDACSAELLDNISIYRISYCTADKVHDKVFAFIAQSGLDDNLECFAFLCTKKKVAQAVTLTVAQAFRVAFEFWQAAKEAKEGGAPPQQSGGGATRSGTEGGQPPSGTLLRDVLHAMKELRLKLRHRGMVAPPTSSSFLEFASPAAAPRPQRLRIPGPNARGTAGGAIRRRIRVYGTTSTHFFSSSIFVPGRTVPIGPSSDYPQGSQRTRAGPI
ncbi:low density lipoprotein receptor adapter protein 1-B-like [Lethenteron reissneri]|uniref:low density lipoprotein receptor adapter protein 1-B-like n=1 Tax=Lethenteron reissneri TaxID=7753 RepID=UPI002AB7EC40|nr:low density lipoprotein receptor adapter protein 1-B-like [Lethenteron reissneri]